MLKENSEMMCLHGHSIRKFLILRGADIADKMLKKAESEGKLL